MALAPTREATNFARVSRLLVDGGAPILRGVFDRAIHPPATLQSFLAANCPALKKLKDKSILHPTQWLLLFPSPPALADSSKFDITLLALLLRNCCGLPPPTKGWNELPPATDLAAQDDICRIKCYRNTIGHASRAILTDVEFTNMWTNIRDAFVRLGGNAAEIDEFKNAYMDRDAERCIETLRQWCLHEKSVEKVEELCQGVEDVKGTLKEMQDQLRELYVQGATTPNMPSNAQEDVVIRDCSSEEQRHLTREVQSLLLFIREEYKRQEASINPFPWSNFQLPLVDIFTKPRLLRKKKGRHTKRDEIHGLYEIFQPHRDCENPKVILLEGKPGMGKTTYCQKLSFDWTTAKSSEPLLARYKILLKLKCRDMKSASIEEAIADQLVPLDVPQEVKAAFFNHIRATRYPVLVVLDGLDELDKDIDLSPLIKKRIFPKSHLLLTSRDDPNLRTCCDTLVEIVGFTLEDAKLFIRRYFGEDEEDAQVLLDKIDDPASQDGEVLRNLISNPLNTALLCAVTEDNDGLLPSNTTLLYQEIIGCVLKMYFKKKVGEPPLEPMLECKEELAVLGRLGLEGIKRDQLKFFKDELESGMTAILEFGFLSKETSSSRINPRISYHFVHKTFQEFFAAFNLYEQLILGGNCPVGDALHLTTYRQVALFLFGLLSQNSDAKVMVTNLITKITQSLSADSSGKTRESFRFICDCVRECSAAPEVQQDMCRAIWMNLAWNEIDLSKCGVSETSIEMKIVCEVLKHNRPLEELNLENNHISDATSLTKSLEENQVLRNLNLRANKLTCVESFGRALEKNKTLHYLYLSANQIRDVTELGRALERNHSLKELGLSDNIITNVDSLGQSLKMNTSLEEIYLNRHNIPNKLAFKNELRAKRPCLKVYC